jgi:hypothetical protein
MKVIVLGDKHNGYDGKLSCLFQEDDEKWSLHFDMDTWVDTATHGLYGGDYLEFYKPIHTKLEFDRSYEMGKEEARYLYKVLMHNGWDQN